MKEEKRQFQQQISSLKADNQRMRTQSESLKSELSKTQGELVGLKVKLELHFNRPFSFGHTKLLDVFSAHFRRDHQNYLKGSLF